MTYTDNGNPFDAILEASWLFLGIRWSHIELREILLKSLR